MAVQFADRALDLWLTNKIKETEKSVQESIGEVEASRKDQGRYLIAQIAFSRHAGYLYALKDTQKQLHEFWGAALKSDQE